MATPTASRRRRTRRLVALSVAVVVAVAVAGVVLATRSDDLHVFGDFRDGRSSQSSPWPVGEPVYVALSVYPEDNREDDGVPENDPPILATLDLRRAEPVVTRNDADADVSVELCRTHHESHAGFMNRRGVHGYCRTLTAFTPGVRRMGISNTDSLDNDLVLAITPHRTGTVRVDGIRLVYDRDGDHGDERPGVGVVIRAR